MYEKKYEVWAPEGKLADNMTLEIALLLIKALCVEYYNQPADYQIKEMERCFDLQNRNRN